MKKLILALSIFTLFFIASSCVNSSNKLGESGIDINSEGLKNYSSFPIGSAVNLSQLEKDKELLKFHIDNFNSITSENSMKMRRIVREKGVFDFSSADKLLEFAEKNNFRLFGHALIWHSSTPKWVYDIKNDSAAIDQLMKDFITKYVGRYKGKVDGWDVVNEAMNTQGGEYRESVWYQALGKDYIAKAFIYAHEADPDAILFYNDFNIERDTAKLHGVIRMINDLKEQGVPISGLGFQMHTRMDISDEIIAYCLKAGAETGLKIHLSEVDIIFNKHDDTYKGGQQIVANLSLEMKEQQALKYQNLVEMYRSLVPKEQQYGITFWGVTDRDTWIKGFFNLEDWPCILDNDLNPKPAYEGFKKGLQSELP